MNISVILFYTYFFFVIRTESVLVHTHLVLGQDAHRAKDQQRLCSNKRRIILFIVLGQDAHRASLNEDFKTPLQSRAKQ